MDYLWSPWRYSYLKALRNPDVCIFCQMAGDPDHDREHLIVVRGTYNFIVLNRFPYTSGHLMIVPYMHADSLSKIDEAAAAELMSLSRTAETKLREVYRPDGLNLGMNIGESAGAGIAGHIHMHMLPRWTGDANFMSTVGQTRILPEELAVTWTRMRDVFSDSR